jgi:extracellular matrix protein 14
MRHFHYLIALLPCVVPVTIATNPPSYPSFNVQPHHSLRFQRPHHVPRPQRNRGRLVQWRDRVIRLLWNAGRHDLPDSANVKSSIADSAPPTSLLARFGEDVILRFSIQSEAEAAAVADAVTVLFLDVWEFTTEWVDIRLSKRVVRLGLMLQREMN